jgi:hypothetical protein
LDGNLFREKMLEEHMDNRVDAGGIYLHPLMMTVTIMLKSTSVAMR